MLHTALSEGIRLLERGRMPRAKQLFQEVLEKNPKSALALSYLGVVEALSDEDPSVGEEKCFRATMMNTKEAQVHANLARVLLAHDNRRGAFEAVSEALARDPANPDALRIRARLGKRRPPAISALPRSSSVNVLLGRLTHKLVGAPA